MARKDHADWLASILSDCQFAFRQLRKSPVFAAVAMLTIGLGVGANTAIFSVVQSVLLAPLPYRQPNRLVVVWETNPRFERTWISYPNFRDWQRTARSFQQMAAFMEQGVDLTRSGTPEHLLGKQISSGFFSTLGTELALGHEFTSEEDRHGGAPVVIISDRLWRSRFGGSTDVLGKTATLSGVDRTIVGVTPPGFALTGNVGFRFEGDTDVYTPLGQADTLVLNNRAAHSGMLCVARLASGVTSSQSQAEMSTIQSGLDQLYPDANRDLGINVEPLKRIILGDVAQVLVLLLGAVVFVLLIACANVANLLLSRSTVRAREFAIRSALGANRARLVRQLLTESVLLSLVGASLGLLIAMIGVRLALARVSGMLPRTVDTGVNASVLLFTLAISIAVGILFGLAPALKSWNAAPQASLKDGGRGSTGAHHRIQSALVVVQIALTLVLLAGAGVLFRTIHRLWEVNPGFDTQNIITFKVGVSPSLTKTASITRVTYQQLLQRVCQIPGVQGADFSNVVPLSGQGAIMPFWINSQKPPSLQSAPRLSAFLTGPDYLRTMGVPLLRGRFFTAEDTTKSPCVAVIDSVFAQKYFQDSDPLNQTITAGFAAFGPCRIIGVVGHVREWELGDDLVDIQNQAYFALYQDPDQWVPINYPDATIVVRSPLDAAILMPLIKRVVYGANSEQPVYNIRTMQQFVSESMSPQRFPMLFLGAFAVLALLLASVGIYGVISYSVAQRLPEIGIRIALGAEKREILRMVVGHGLRLTALGLAIGATAALILIRLVSAFSQLLYGVGASDPATFVTVSLILTLVAILACYVPARRAMSVDPLAVLRHE